MFNRKHRREPPGPPVEGRMVGRWHPETFWCSLNGHRVPAVEVKNLEDPNSLIAMPIPGGTHVGRCLRCDAWILANPELANSQDLPDLTDLEIPQRGKHLRDAIILKVIAVDRGLHAIFFALVFIGLILIETNLVALKDTARHLVSNAQNTIAGTGQGSGQLFIERQLDKFTHLDESSLIVLLVTAGAYVLVEGIEAYGLWMQRRWAEYLTVIATAGLLPLEIHELIKAITVVRVGALVINIAVLVYLVYAKRLFGFRGGAERDEALIASAEQIERLPGQPTPES